MRRPFSRLFDSGIQVSCSHWQTFYTCLSRNEQPFAAPSPVCRSCIFGGGARQWRCIENIRSYVNPHKTLYFQEIYRHLYSSHIKYKILPYNYCQSISVEIHLVISYNFKLIQFSNQLKCNILEIFQLMTYQQSYL